MAETTYTTVTWTTGDFITEAKMDNMVANDRAVDAIAQGLEFVERADPSTPGSNKLHLYLKDKSGVPVLYAINDAGTIYELSEGRPTVLFTVIGTLITGTSLTPIAPMHRTVTFVKAFAIVKTNPTGQKLIIDINKNGSTIFGATKLEIAAGAASGSQTSFNVTTASDEDQMTLDIDQVGSTVPGADLSVYLRSK